MHQPHLDIKLLSGFEETEEAFVSERLEGFKEVVAGGILSRSLRSDEACCRYSGAAFEASVPRVGVHVDVVEESEGSTVIVGLGFSIESGFHVGWSKEVLVQVDRALFDEAVGDFGAVGIIVAYPKSVGSNVGIGTEGVELGGTAFCRFPSAFSVGDKYHLLHRFTVFHTRIFSILVEEGAVEVSRGHGEFDALHFGLILCILLALDIDRYGHLEIPAFVEQLAGGGSVIGGRFARLGELRLVGVHQADVHHDVSWGVELKHAFHSDGVVRTDEFHVGSAHRTIPRSGVEVEIAVGAVGVLFIREGCSVGGADILGDEEVLMYTVLTVGNKLRGDVGTGIVIITDGELIGRTFLVGAHLPALGTALGGLPSFAFLEGVGDDLCRFVGIGHKGVGDGELALSQGEHHFGGVAVVFVFALVDGGGGVAAASGNHSDEEEQEK